MYSATIVKPTRIAYPGEAYRVVYRATGAPVNMVEWLAIKKHFEFVFDPRALPKISVTNVRGYASLIYLDRVYIDFVQMVQETVSNPFPDILPYLDENGGTTLFMLDTIELLSDPKEPIPGSIGATVQDATTGISEAAKAGVNAAKATANESLSVLGSTFKVLLPLTLIAVILVAIAYGAKQATALR